MKSVLPDQDKGHFVLVQRNGLYIKRGENALVNRPARRRLSDLDVEVDLRVLPGFLGLRGTAPHDGGNSVALAFG